MQSLAILLLSLPVAQAAPEPTPLAAPEIKTVWDSRGSETTDSNAMFDNQATLRVRVRVPLQLKEGKVDLFLNGSTRPEEYLVVDRVPGEIVYRLKRVFRRGQYDLRAQFSSGSLKSEISKPATFVVYPPPAPKIQTVYEGDIALPLNPLRDVLIFRKGSDVNVEMIGTLPGDEVGVYLQTKGFPEEVLKRTIEDKPVREPVNIDFTTITGLQKGVPYTVLVRLVRKGDASEYSRFRIQIGLKREACDGLDH